jgi:hypothetical protein
MGTLDDAIREHLELKRSQGASEEELGRAESEALGRGRPMVDLSPEKPPPEKAAEMPAKAAADEPTADHQPSMLEEAEVPAVLDDAATEPDTPAEGTKAALAAEPAWSHALEELEPDEVLPEEVLDPDALPAVERMPPSERLGDVGDEDVPLDDGEDVLEETPDFLEETPEHDRLWFEQKPPKDFDFGD